MPVRSRQERIIGLKVDLDHVRLCLLPAEELPGEGAHDLGRSVNCDPVHMIMTELVEGGPAQELFIELVEALDLNTSRQHPFTEVPT